MHDGQGTMESSFTRFRYDALKKKTDPDSGTILYTPGRVCSTERIFISNKILKEKQNLALAELESSTCSTLTVLLALNHAGITSKITVGLESRTAVGINLSESP